MLRVNGAGCVFIPSIAVSAPELSSLTRLRDDQEMLERRTFLTSAAATGAILLLGCSKDDDNPPPDPSPSVKPTPTESSTKALAEPQVLGEIANGLNVPWGIAFLPGGDALVSERDTGNIMRITAGGDVKRIGNLPGSVGFAGGEGGALGLALDPDDPTSLYAYLTTKSDNRVMRFRIDGDRLSRPRVILDGIPTGSRHHGGRLAFDRHGSLFVSTGEAGQPPLAQDPNSLGGKILRIDRAGNPVEGNPFSNHVWSYGHRNVEGLAFDAEGRLWATEFGDQTADELNVIVKGGNYGWPQTEGKTKEAGLRSPKAVWAPSECSPAGIAISGSVAYFGALRGERLYAVELRGASVARSKSYFVGKYGRIRTVAVAPDGTLWMTTSNTDGRGRTRSGDDRILRLSN